jgi:putative alpha-1,2-mannosidase
VTGIEFWSETYKARRAGESKNARGIWAGNTQISGVYCHVHDFAGWMDVLGGAQRWRRRVQNLQGVLVIY